MKYRNDEAVGAIVALVLTFILASIVFAVVGFGIDRLTTLSLQVMTENASQLRYDSLNIQLVIFRIEPLLMFFGICLNYWAIRMRQFGANIELGGMLKSAAEMILGTFTLMILGFFGGGALEMVTSTIDAWDFVPLADSYLVIQYLIPVFYGIIDLLIISLIVLFIMRCLQVTDFSSTPPLYG